MHQVTGVLGGDPLAQVAAAVVAGARDAPEAEARPQADRRADPRPDMDPRWEVAAMTDAPAVALSPAAVGAATEDHVVARGVADDDRAVDPDDVLGEAPAGRVPRAIAIVTSWIGGPGSSRRREASSSSSGDFRERLISDRSASVSRSLGTSLRSS